MSCARAYVNQGVAISTQDRESESERYRETSGTWSSISCGSISRKETNISACSGHFKVFCRGRGCERERAGANRETRWTIRTISLLRVFAFSLLASEVASEFANVANRLSIVQDLGICEYLGSREFTNLRIRHLGERERKEIVSTFQSRLNYGCYLTHLRGHM
jgi:hypothetical protein